MRKARRATLYFTLCMQLLSCHAFFLNEFGLNEYIEGVTESANFSSWSCTEDVDCTVNNSACVRNACECPPGYVYNSQMTSCLKVAIGIEDECEENVQCSTYLLTGGTCIENICKCAPGYHYLHGRCYKSIGLAGSCRNDDECYVNADTEASSCHAGTCKCSEGFYPREFRTCRRAALEVGQECMVNMDCRFSKNAVCNSQFLCVDDTDKPVPYTAIDPYNVSLVTQTYTKVAHTVVQCTSDKNCENLTHAFCDPTGTCTCKRAHFISSDGTKCIPELGEPCVPMDVAVIRNSICRNGKWSCNKGTVATANNKMCKKIANQYRGSCLINESCFVFGPDSFCESKKCVCNENSHFVEKDMFCWRNKAIGESCQVNEDCYVKGYDGQLTCKENVCACPEGSHSNSEGTSCIGNLGRIGDKCELNSDCKVKGTTCVNEACICGKHYYKVDDMCMPGIGAGCWGDYECMPNNSTCYGRTCACKKNFAPASVNLCVPVAEYGAKCEYDVQCAAFLRNTACTPEIIVESKSTTASSRTTKNKFCLCIESHHYRFEKCYEKKVLGESCKSLGECYLSEYANRGVCKNGQCACTFGYKSVNNVTCVWNPHGPLTFNGAAVRPVVATLWIPIAVLLVRYVTPL